MCSQYHFLQVRICVRERRDIVHLVQMLYVDLFPSNKDFMNLGNFDAQLCQIRCFRA